MIFQKLIQSNNWLSVQGIFLQLYPDQKKSINGYEKVFSDLQQMKSVVSEFELIIEEQVDSFDGEVFVGVCGKKQSVDTTESEKWALDFTPWEEWLSMTISKDSLENFTELEIIAHCLYEMTFIGFNEETIQKELNKLDESVKEFENMAEENKKKNTMSIDELMKRLDKDDESHN